MYHYYKWGTVYLVKHEENADFRFGPFHNESDCHFIVELLNSGTITFSKGVPAIEEDSQDPNSIHKYLK